jgi:purine-binding chemotaxis protein CheW
MKNEIATEKSSAAGKYLAFSLGAETYAVNILEVREIIRLSEITLVPQMPRCVRGVINLRGKIVPVIDLRTRFGFEKAPTTERTCIVVTFLPGRGLIGLIVDAVEDVLQLTSMEVQDAPDFGPAVETDCLVGIARHKNKTVTLLNLPAVCSPMKDF